MQENVQRLNEEGKLAKPPKFRLIIPDDCIGNTPNRGGTIAVAAHPPAPWKRRLIRKLTGWDIQLTKIGDQA